MKSFWKNKRAVGLLLLLAAPLAGAEDESSYRRAAAVLHVHSLVSPHGKSSLQAVAVSAKKRGVDVLIPTDHFLERWEYGLPPLDGIFRKSVVRRCIYTFGPENYLRLVEKVQKDNPSLLIIPGLEASPAYYWSGHLFQGNLTLHEPQRHLLIMGITDPAALRRLPLLSNPDAGEIQWKSLLLPTLLVATGLALLIRWPAGLILVAIGLLWGFNQRPLRRLPPAYEQFTRNGYDAAQHLIDYANAHGAVTLWSHPEAPNWVEARKLYRSVSMQSLPYPEAVLKTERFSGFGYFWEGEKVLGPPGGMWDQALAAYARGERERPIWAFGELDWTEDTGEDFTLSSMENILWVKEKTARDVLDAFRSGRFYLFKNSIRTDLALERWNVSDGVNTALSGGEGIWSPRAALNIEVRISPRAVYTDLEVEILRNGAVWKKLTGKVVLNARIELPSPEEGKKDFYRLDVRAYGGRIVSNPIFVGK